MGHFYHHESLCEALIRRPFKYIAVAAVAYTLGHMGGCNKNSIESELMQDVKDSSQYQVMYQVNDNQATSFLVYQRASFPIPLDQAKDASISTLYKTHVKPQLEK